MGKDKSKAVKIWVSASFDALIRDGHAKMNQILIERYGKDMTFIDYTDFLATVMGSTAIIPVSKEMLQPIKRGKSSNKIVLDFSS